jgi:hypothetical protein
MTEAIIVAVITSGCTLFGVIIQNYKHNKSISDLIEYRMKIIERKQDKYNNVLERMMAIENSVNLLDEKQKVADHRIADLENNK